jgi:hypothetical protein
MSVRGVSERFDGRGALRTHLQVGFLECVRGQPLGPTRAEASIELEDGNGGEEAEGKRAVLSGHEVRLKASWR